MVVVEVGVVGLEARLGHGARSGDQARGGGRAGEEVVEGLLGGVPARGVVRGVDVARHHHADAGHRRRDGDEPEPAAIAAGHHPNVAGAPAASSRDAFELAVHGDVLQHRVLPALAELLGEKPGASRRVDHGADSRLDCVAVAAGVNERHAVGVEGRALGAAALQHERPAGGGVLEQQLVEPRARHLVGAAATAPPRPA